MSFQVERNLNQMPPDVLRPFRELIEEYQGAFSEQQIDLANAFGIQIVAKAALCDEQTFQRCLQDLAVQENKTDILVLRLLVEIGRSHVHGPTEFHKSRVLELTRLRPDSAMLKYHFCTIVTEPQVL
jgi:hypothetical protein